jgi:hypothetical protein
MVSVEWKIVRVVLSLLVFYLVISSPAFSQEKKSDDKASSNENTVSVDSSLSQSSSNILVATAIPAPYDIGSDGKSFLKDILKDQQAIFTSPAHIKKKDLWYVVPIGIAMASLLATDRQYMVEVNEHPGREGTRFSYRVGQASNYPTAIGIVVAFYGFGKIKHNDHLKETGKADG